MLPFLLLILLLPAACDTGPQIPGGIWYDHVDVVCRDDMCGRCGGSCAYDCPPCRGAGEVTCSSCSDGTEKCSRCKGDGSRHGKPCKRCDGTGKRECSRCDGDQMMTCDTCDGGGKVMCIRQMPVVVPELTDPMEAWPPGNVRMEK
jgi:hypothetical protein